MKVAVSYNKSGEITLMFDPSKMQSEEFTIGYAPAPGETHQLLDLPKQFEGKQLKDFAHNLHVKANGKDAKLEVKA
jgi:hypothetical protein